MRIKHNDTTITFGNVKINIVFGRPKIVTSPPYDGPPKYAFQSHPHFELYITEYGNGHIALPDSKPIKFSRNTAILVPPSMLHARYQTPDTTSKQIVINFDYSKINPKSHDVLNDYMNTFFNKFGSVLLLKDKFFGQFTKNIESQYEDEPVLANLLISNIFEGFFLHILRTLNKTNTENELSSIYKYKSSEIKNEVTLAKDIDDFMGLPGCTLSGLAAHLDMSTRNTQRIIKNIYGGSYSEIMAERRLELAVEYMKNNRYSLIEISQMVGYNQYASFRKAFISKYGISPQNYRKKYS